MAYYVTRRLATDARFSFGTGKINSLAGFTSAVLLLGFALLMVTESIGRLIAPVPIVYDQALIVAVAGLVVNALSAWLLAGTPHDHDHGHGHGHHHNQDDHGHDHNLRAAYLHVLADALTSLLAIVALLAAKFYGLNALDPVMGIVGAILVTRWSLGLIRESAMVLLDRQADEETIRALREAIERGSSDRVADLHCWQIGHGIYAAEIAVVSDSPQSADHYRSLLPQRLGIVHATVEVNLCREH